MPILRSFVYLEGDVWNARNPTFKHWVVFCVSASRDFFGMGNKVCRPMGAMGTYCFRVLGDMLSKPSSQGSTLRGQWPRAGNKGSPISLNKGTKTKEQRITNFGQDHQQRNKNTRTKRNRPGGPGAHFGPSSFLHAPRGAPADARRWRDSPPAASGSLRTGGISPTSRGPGPICRVPDVRWTGAAVEEKKWRWASDS